MARSWRDARSEAEGLLGDYAVARGWHLPAEERLARFEEARTLSDALHAPEGAE